MCACVHVCVRVCTCVRECVREGGTHLDDAGEGSSAFRVANVIRPREDDVVWMSDAPVQLQQPLGVTIIQPFVRKHRHALSVHEQTGKGKLCRFFVETVVVGGDGRLYGKRCEEGVGEGEGVRFEEVGDGNLEIRCGGVRGGGGRRRGRRRGRRGGNRGVAKAIFDNARLSYGIVRDEK